MQLLIIKTIKWLSYKKKYIQNLFFLKANEISICNYPGNWLCGVFNIIVLLHRLGIPSPPSFECTTISTLYFLSILGQDIKFKVKVVIIILPSKLVASFDISQHCDKRKQSIALN